MRPTIPTILTQLTATAKQKPLPTVATGVSILALVTLYLSYQRPPAIIVSIPAAAAVLPTASGDVPPPSNVSFHAGAPFRDYTPIVTAQGFVGLAEAEVAALNLETCRGLLGWEMVLAYKSTQIEYCASDDPEHGAHAACFPVRYSEFTRWWPYPNAYCVSRNLQPQRDDIKKFFGKCQATNEGHLLKGNMDSERFLGTHLTEVQDVSIEPSKQINHTMLYVTRQDQWNPFHVAEDLVTSILALLIAGTAFPALTHEKIQLAFADDFDLERNHFTPLWDRMGAWPPRRLSVDPWEPKTSFTNVVHSIGAGSSLLSATGVGQKNLCASTLVWGSSHYYRNLFGLVPPTPHQVDPINILWLSREKMNAHLSKIHDFKGWQKERQLENEPELIARFKSGLASLCDAPTSRCEYQDAEEYPEWWSSPTTPHGQRALRFYSIDPSVHALSSQIDFVGHTTILAGLHGGALGLSLFLPPSRAAIFELHTSTTAANKHFHNMAHFMGHRYETTRVNLNVDVERTWGALKALVEERLRI